MAAMDRRKFLGAICGACAAPAVGQQPARMWRIGYLGNTRLVNPALVETLRQLGYVEGVTAVIEARFADGRDDRLPALAAELVAARVDVMVVLSGPGIIAAKAASTTIPIVMAGVSDPVGRGIVASYAHPDGNITGIANLALETNLKRIELLKEAVPRVSRVVTAGSWDASVVAALEKQDADARALGVTVRRVQIRAPSEIDSVLATIAGEQIDGLVLLPAPLTYRLRKEFSEFARARKLPSIGWHAEQAAAGILVTYGASIDGIFRDSAKYVDKILKGAKPADLPIERPTTFELMVNLATAKQIGVTLPQSLLLRADEKIT
jgi:putative ABC transport system substrate-binding protein